MRERQREQSCSESTIIPDRSCSRRRAHGRRSCQHHSSGTGQSHAPMARRRPRRPASIWRRTQLAAAVLATALSPAAAQSCISLRGSSQCPAFNASSFSTSVSNLLFVDSVSRGHDGRRTDLPAAPSSPLSPLPKTLTPASPNTSTRPTCRPSTLQSPLAPGAMAFIFAAH